VVGPKVLLRAHRTLLYRKNRFLGYETESRIYTEAFPSLLSQLNTLAAKLYRTRLVLYAVPEDQTIPSPFL
jgi:hypothetical protein